MTDAYVSNGEVIDCRSEEGVTIGLIDALISISRILNKRLLSSAGTKAISEALSDLGSDNDVVNIMAHANYEHKNS